MIKLRPRLSHQPPSPSHAHPSLPLRPNVFRPRLGSDARPWHLDGDEGPPVFADPTEEHPVAKMLDAVYSPCPTVPCHAIASPGSPELT